MNDRITINIEMHPSGRGFRITAVQGNNHVHYPKPILDVGDALKKAFFLRNAIEKECNVHIPDKDIRISQESIEMNAPLSENNIKAYSGIMTGKVRVSNDSR